MYIWEFNYQLFINPGSICFILPRDLPAMDEEPAEKRAASPGNYQNNNYGQMGK